MHLPFFDYGASSGPGYQGWRVNSVERASQQGYFPSQGCQEGSQEWRSLRQVLKASEGSQLDAQGWHWEECNSGAWESRSWRLLEEGETGCFLFVFLFFGCAACGILVP